MKLGVLGSGHVGQVLGPGFAAIGHQVKIRTHSPAQDKIWNGPNFKRAVEATGRRNLIMAGVTTYVCLVYPVISACCEGYQVQAIMDASGSPYEISEEMARRRMEREGLVLTATKTLMAELAQDWSRPEGSQLLGILFQEVLPPIA